MSKFNKRQSEVKAESKTMSIQSTQVKKISSTAIELLAKGNRKWGELIAAIIAATTINNATRVQTCLIALGEAGRIKIIGDGKFAVVSLVKDTVPSPQGMPSDGGNSKESGFKSWSPQSAEAAFSSKAAEGSYTKIQTDELKKAIEKLNNEVKAAKEAALQAKLDAEKKIAEAMKNLPKAEVIEVQLKSGPKIVKKTTGLFHQQFKTIMQLAEGRENVFIYGPTGCGKTHVCEQVAESLNLPFAFVSCTTGMSEGIVGGRLLPVGEGGKFEYVCSEFVKAYETGGVFLLDEIDAADPNVLLFINSALANGKASVPNRQENPYALRHDDFICVAAANTVGTGADRLYAGRNKLDMSTLDRFQIGKVLMDYDPRVEQALCEDDALRAHLLKYRKAIQAHRLERAMSTRFMASAFKMQTKFNWTHEQIDTAFFSGWRDDEINKVKAHY